MSTDATSDEQVYLVAFDVNTCQGGLCHHSLVWSEPIDALELLDMAQQDGNERLRYIFEDLDNGEEKATGTDFKDDDQIGENDLNSAKDVRGIVGAVARDLLASGAWEDADFAHHSCSLGCRLSNAAEASLKVVAVATAVAASGVCIAASFGVCAGAVAAGWAIRSGFALAAHGGDAWGSIAIDAGLSYATLATAGASSAVFAGGSKSAAYEVLSAGQAGYSPLQKYGVLAAVESHGLAGSVALTLRGD